MKVLVTVRLPQEVLSLITRWHEVDSNPEDRPMPRAELLEKIGDRDGLLYAVTDRVDDELLECAPKLKMVANYAVGYDNVDLAAATARGIRVSDAPADLTFALILAVARRVVEGDKLTREGQFKYFAPLLFLGRDVSGKNLGIIGLGNSGKAVARRARGFNMPVLYYSRRRIPEVEERELGVSYVTMEELLAQSDFVSLHIPLGAETRHFIGREQLKQMKPTAFLINASRGPVVDEQALVEDLQLKQIAGAGLDVYENEPALTPGLTDLQNVVLMPHSGSATRETRTKMASLAAENLLAGLRGELPPNCLNCA